MTCTNVGADGKAMLRKPSCASELMRSGPIPKNWVQPPFKKCPLGPKRRKSLRKVSRVRNLETFSKPPGVAPGDFFRLSRFRDRRARETPVNGQHVSTSKTITYVYYILIFRITVRTAKITDWTFIILARSQVINYWHKASLELFQVISALRIFVVYKRAILPTYDLLTRGGSGNYLGNCSPTSAQKSI